FQSGEFLRDLGSHDGFVFTVAFSPDSRLAASGGGGVNNDGKFLAGSDHDIRIWDLESVTGAAAAPQQALGRKWLISAGIVVFMMALSLCALWWYVRQGRRTGKTLAYRGNEKTAKPVSR